MKPMENKHTQYVDFSNPNADKITTGVTNKPMINKKQTAVEWLVNVVQSCIAPNFIPKEIVEQAKEMEKEQIIDACNLQRNDYRGMPTYNKSGEQYYNETYN
jgi:hypothetical protein